MDKLILEPLIQYGFLGFSAVLLGVVIWLIRRLLFVISASNRVIAANTEAIVDLCSMTRDLLALNRSINNKLLARPCIARKENGSGC